MTQTENMEASLRNWANRFEQECKQNAQIKEHEIYIEAYQSAQFLCLLDRRGRWNGHPEQTTSNRFRFSCTIILHNNKQAQKSYLSQLDRSPAQIVTELIAKADKDGHPLANAQKYHHLSLETWDPRYPRMTMEHRIELFEWNISTLRSLNKNVRIKQYMLIEEEHFRLYHSSRNANRFDKSTMFHFSAELSDALTEQIFRPHSSSHRFADISSEILGLSHFEKKIPAPQFKKTIDDDFLLILPSHIIAHLVELMYPAFDLERIEQNESFLSGKKGQRIGSDKVHLLDNALLPSGYNSRPFDSRGFAPQVLTLINEGIFQDCYVRHPLRGYPPSGHQNFQGNLWPGNLLAHNGRRSLNMVLADRSMALIASELLAPIEFDIATGHLRILANYNVISSNGVEGELGAKEISCNIIDVFSLVLETINDQTRSRFIDSSSWVLENCSLFSRETV